MSTKRKHYGATEKAKIALEAIRGNSTLAEISSRYDVHATQINQWKREALERLPGVFADKTKALKVDYESQLCELYQQIGRLKVENDFLKKNVTVLAVPDRRLLLEPAHEQLSIRQQCELLRFSGLAFTTSLAQ
jgi:putative transposase